MPEIARLFGIIIRMFAEPAAPHHRPHFHAYYQDDVGIGSHSPAPSECGATQLRA